MPDDKDKDEVMSSNKASEWLSLYYQELEHKVDVDEAMQTILTTGPQEPPFYFIAGKIGRDYELTYISTLPEGKNVEVNKIYLNQDGYYVVRSVEGNVEKGRLFGFDQKDLESKINDSELKLRILAETNKSGYTSKLYIYKFDLDENSNTPNKLTYKHIPSLPTSELAEILKGLDDDDTLKNTCSQGYLCINDLLSNDKKKSLDSKLKIKSEVPLLRKDRLAYEVTHFHMDKVDLLMPKSTETYAVVQGPLNRNEETKNMEMLLEALVKPILGKAVTFSANLEEKTLIATYSGTTYDLTRMLKKVDWSQIKRFTKNNGNVDIDVENNYRTFLETTSIRPTPSSSWEFKLPKLPKVSIVVGDSDPDLSAPNTIYIKEAPTPPKKLFLKKISSNLTLSKSKKSNTNQVIEYKAVDAGGNIVYDSITTDGTFDFANWENSIRSITNKRGHTTIHDNKAKDDNMLKNIKHNDAQSKDLEGLTDSEMLSLNVYSSNAYAPMNNLLRNSPDFFDDLKKENNPHTFIRDLLIHAAIAIPACYSNSLIPSENLEERIDQKLSKNGLRGGPKPDYMRRIVIVPEEDKDNHPITKTFFSLIEEKNREKIHYNFDNSFQSTTLNKSVYSEILPGNKVIFRYMNVVPGLSIRALSAHPKESEFLLPPGSGGLIFEKVEKVADSFVVYARFVRSPVNVFGQALIDKLKKEENKFNLEEGPPNPNEPNDNTLASSQLIERLTKTVEVFVKEDFGVEDNAYVDSLLKKLKKPNSIQLVEFKQYEQKMEELAKRYNYENIKKRRIDSQKWHRKAIFGAMAKSDSSKNVESPKIPQPSESFVNSAPAPNSKSTDSTPAKPKSNSPEKKPVIWKTANAGEKLIQLTQKSEDAGDKAKLVSPNPEGTEENLGLTLPKTIFTDNQPGLSDPTLINTDDQPELNDTTLINTDDQPELNDTTLTNTDDQPQLNNPTLINNVDQPGLNDPKLITNDDELSLGVPKPRDLDDKPGLDEANPAALPSTSVASNPAAPASGPASVNSKSPASLISGAPVNKSSPAKPPVAKTAKPPNASPNPGLQTQTAKDESLWEKQLIRRIRKNLEGKGVVHKGHSFNRYEFYLFAANAKLQYSRTSGNNASLSDVKKENENVIRVLNDYLSIAEKESRKAEVDRLITELTKINKEIEREMQRAPKDDKQTAAYIPPNDIIFFTMHYDKAMRKRDEYLGKKPDDDKDFAIPVMSFSSGTAAGPTQVDPLSIASKNYTVVPMQTGDINAVAVRARDDKGGIRTALYVNKENAEKLRKNKPFKLFSSELFSSTSIPNLESMRLAAWTVELHLITLADKKDANQIYNRGSNRELANAVAIYCASRNPPVKCNSTHTFDPEELAKQVKLYKGKYEVETKEYVEQKKFDYAKQKLKHHKIDAPSNRRYNPR